METTSLVIVRITQSRGPSAKGLAGMAAVRQRCASLKSFCAAPDDLFTDGIWGLKTARRKSDSTNGAKMTEALRPPAEARKSPPSVSRKIASESGVAGLGSAGRL